MHASTTFLKFSLRLAPLASVRKSRASHAGRRRLLALILALIYAKNQVGAAAIALGPNVSLAVHQRRVLVRDLLSHAFGVAVVRRGPTVGRHARTRGRGSGQSGPCPMGKGFFACPVPLGEKVCRPELGNLAFTTVKSSTYRKNVGGNAPSPHALADDTLERERKSKISLSR